jgi:hypothetical protein
LPSSYYIPQTKEIAVKDAEAINNPDAQKPEVENPEAGDVNEGETTTPENTNPPATPESGNEQSPDTPVPEAPADTPENTPSSGEVITTPGTGDLPEQIL